MINLRPSVFEVTTNTEIVALKEIAAEFKEFFKVEYCVQSGKEKFHSTDEFFFAQELLKGFSKNPYWVSVNLNGMPCYHILKTNEMEDSYTANTFRALLHLKRIYLDLNQNFNSNRYKVGNIVKFADMLKDIHCDANIMVLYNNATKPMIDKTMEKYKSCWANGEEFDRFEILHCPESVTSESWREYKTVFPDVPYMASVKTQAWCGGIDAGNVMNVLEYLYNNMANRTTIRIGARNGMLTDGKTDLNKVYDYLNNIKTWKTQKEQEMSK